MQTIENIPELKPRTSEAHKGDFGRVCIIAGSFGMTGAASLAGRAALRAGAGLVRIATAKSALPIVASMEPCYTTIGLVEDSSGKISGKAINAIVKLGGENNVLAFGPGLGVSNGIKTILEKLIEQENLKLVIDADGLNNLAKIKSWPKKLKADVILTPHPGEMKRLWAGLSREPLANDRRDQAMQLAKQTETIIVLKGAGTIVTDGEKVYTNKTGNTGMATAGSGDVLTGVIAALIGQGLNNFDAGVLGVYIHGLAGDIAVEKTGQVSLMATDIIESLCVAFKKS